MGKGKKRTSIAPGSSGIGGTSNQRNVLAAKNETSIADQLLPGRHPCKCQARKHQLVMNCLGCGKIVCMQEGSGPCFCCGTLTCTAEERELLNRDSKKSAELYEKLMGKPYEGAKSLSLSNLGLDLNKATEFRNKLLEADADSERTKVFDLESDYSHVEKDPFLSADERKRVRKRLQELKDMKEQKRKQLVLNLNLLDLSVSEQKTTYTNQCDPVIEEIMHKSEERRKAVESMETTAVDARWIPKGFVPKYPRDGGATFRSNISDYTDTDSVSLMNETAAILEVESKGFSIAAEQPYASLISYGKIKYIRWTEDLQLKGPVFVCSFPKAITIADIRKTLETYSTESAAINLDFTPGSIHGRVFLQDCLTIAEFQQEYGNDTKLAGKGDFVLIFTVCEPLRIPIPYIPSSSFFQLDKEMRRAMADVFKS